MMGDYVERTLECIKRLEAQINQEPGTTLDEYLEGSYLCRRFLTQLGQMRKILEYGLHEPTRLEGHRAVHRELHRAMMQTETSVKEWCIPGHHNDERALGKRREDCRETFLAARWWTMVTLWQAGHGYRHLGLLPFNVAVLQPGEKCFYGDVPFMERKGELQVNSQSRPISSYERQLPSVGLEAWLDHRLQWEVEFGNILGKDESIANMALEAIRRADYQVVVTEDMPAIYVDEAKLPLIEEEVTLDLTRDVLGVSRTGAWVIRTKCQGVDCALKRVTDGDNEPVLARLSHPHIVQLMHYWRKDEYMFLVMELMEGDLTDLLSRHKRANDTLLSVSVAVDIMLQTAKGMLYLHDLGITYPHLSCSNVLFRESGVSQDGGMQYIIKLGGFRNCAWDASGGKKQDVYLFGLLCLEVLTGRQQCEDPLDMVADTRPSIPETIPPVLRFCISSCFESNVQLGFAQVVTLLLLAQVQVLKSQEKEVFLSFGTCEDLDLVQLNQQYSETPSASDADLEKYPVHQLYPEPDVAGSDFNPSATLIFFHGFAKSSDEWKSTWMTRNREHVWPKAWLPKDLPGNVRILSLSYDIDAPGESQDTGAIEIGKNALRQLVLSSKWKLADPKAKVILIGHSFGGLVIKSLVVEAHNLAFVSGKAKTEEPLVLKCPSFLENLKGIVFYSVPGSASQDQQFENYIVKLNQTGLLQRSSLMQALLKDTRLFNQQMISLCSQFEEIVPEKTQILGFIEGKGMRRVVVSDASARAEMKKAEFNIVEEDNHFEVCRPVSADHKGYKILVDFLKDKLKIGLLDFGDNKGHKVGSTASPLSQGAIRLPPNCTCKFPRTQFSTPIKTQSARIVGVDIPFNRLKASILTSHAKDTVSHLGLHGRGGAGKTLLAQMLHNDKDIAEKYGADSIVWITVGLDARVADLYKTMATFLQDRGFEKHYGHRSLQDQRTYLWNALARKKVFLVLDDVWQERCEENHVMMYWLNIATAPGSATLITTRNYEVLSKVYAESEVVLSLSEEDSWTLFCSHAFHDGSVPAAVPEDLAKEVCKECKGLPLALKVVGSAMVDKVEVGEWNSALHDLKQSKPILGSIVDNELFGRLRWSYDKLECDVLKTCFLYFAAFPEDYEIPTTGLSNMWISEGLVDGEDEARAHLKVLEGRSLIHWYHDKGYAQVHDILRDLALLIIDTAKAGECGYDCYFQSGKVLKTFPAQKSLRRLSFSNTTIPEALNSLQAPQLQVCLLSGIVGLDAQLQECFSNLDMTSLKYLDLSRNPSNNLELALYSKSLGKLKHLIHLDLSRCESLEQLPESIGELKCLVHLDLSGCSSLKHLPESMGELKCLTHLDLSECEALKQLPESMGELKCLVHLNLFYCWSLKQLPESVGELKCLVHLNLSYCWFLEQLPESMGELKCLAHLDLFGCDSLKQLPESMGELKCLVHLDLSGCGALKQLPESMGKLKCLVHLNLSGCESLEQLPESMGEWKCLAHLDLSGCSSLEQLPESMGKLKCLVHLDLSGCGALKQLPESIGKLKCLAHLDLSECESLEQLPKSMGELKCLVHLNLTDCGALEQLSESMGELKCLVHLNLSGCGALKQLPESMGEWKCLAHLDLSECSSLEQLPEGIGELKCLVHLNLSRYRSLKQLPESIGELKCLVHLNLSGCSSLEQLPKSMGELKCLVHLNLTGCGALEQLSESMGELKCLVHLDLSGCGALKQLPESMGEWKCLAHLDLSECSSLEQLPEGIGELKCLVHLNLSRYRSFKQLPESMGELKCLVHLNLSGCSSLEQLPESIGELKCLVHLNLSGCSSLEQLPKSMGELKCLVHLNLTGCGALEQLSESMGELKCLVHLDLSGCGALKQLPESMGEWKCLAHLDLSECSSLEQLPEGIGELKCLVHLNLSRYRSFKQLPESMGELKCLVHLNLSGCSSLEQLPESIGELKCLVHLNLSGCGALEQLPESMGKLKCLVHLDLSGCGALKQLPESMGEWKCLAHLDLSGCSSLEQLPKSIGELKCLVHLNLSRYRSLKQLPESMGKLKCLVHLNLSGCSSLEQLPESIGELKCLVHLNLSGCSSLEQLPKSIGELKCLVHLNLYRCRSLEQLPKSIGELKCLVHLNLSVCGSLKQLPESMGELKCLVHLNLSVCGSLKQLPESMGELKCLVHLKLSYCWSLKQLPESMGKLKCLAHLDLSECEALKQLPESMGELKCLVDLDLSECSSLKQLPESMGELKCLVDLDLSECSSLKQLPESMGELKCLVHLNLSYCWSLKQLLESMGKLKCLAHLDLSGCRALKQLPESMGELKCLVHLNLSVCESLKQLPESMGKLKCLAHLYLSGCGALKQLPESMGELKCLMHLDLSGCSSLEQLPESMGELKCLAHLDLSRCSSLKQLPENMGESKCRVIGR